MRLTDEDTLASMMKEVYGELRDLKSQRGVDDVPVQVRVVSETEVSSDSSEVEIDEDPGWTWGESAWGYDIWR